MHSKLGEFDVIYCDAPWAYAEVPYFKKSLAVQYQYSPLKTKDLLNIDVESIAKKHSWLYLWTVWAKLKQALDVIDAWGFSYRTCAFVWAKKTKHGKNAKTFGRCCTQGSTEIILVGKRGSPARHAQNVEQFIEAQRRKHSQKPDEIYERIERVVELPDQPVRKIELFARQQWGDWWALGNDEALDQPDNEKALFGDIRDIIGVKNASETV